MRQAVPAQVTVPSEHFAAVGAIVGLDVRVGQQVGLEVAPLVETPAARRTLVRRVFHVQDLVDGQCPRLAEPLAALVALEGLLLGMDVPVVPKMVLPSECFSTDVAGVGPFICVGPFVD